METDSFKIKRDLGDEDDKAILKLEFKDFVYMSG